MRNIITFLLLTAVSIYGDCDLACHQSAPCLNGNADFSNHSTYADGSPLGFHAVTQENGMHCACPHGWTGVTCNRIYNSCDGGHKCYNGGSCIPGLQDYYGNEQLFCDCSDAMDENGFPFVGKFCEHVTMEKCGTKGVFCVNGGECNRFGTQCDCSPGFEGPHCEFKKGSVPVCDLQCENAGECQLGLPKEPNDFHDLKNLYLTNTSTTEDAMHCICPPGFGGKLCTAQKDKCGSEHCYHGGTCVSRVDNDGITRHQCDCSTAETVNSNYAGRFCQYESTSFCTKEENQNGRLFCVNGGTCKGDDFEGCDCGDDLFYGPSCEFKHLPQNNTQPPTSEVSNNDNDNNNTAPTNHPAPARPTQDDGQHLDHLDQCNLQCENFGICRKGSKDIGVISHIAAHVAELNQTYNDDFEHCVCRENFVGLRCEHKIEICPGGEHVCLHGSKCVQNENSCDCSASTTHVLAGSSCEHKNYASCNKGELRPAQPRSFCVNGGTCLAMVSGTQDHAGCNCDDEWIGPHCELHKASVESSNMLEIPQDSGSVANSPTQPVPVVDMNENGGGGFTTAVLVISILALLASVAVSAGTHVRNRGHQHRMEQEHKLTMALANNREERSTLELKPMNHHNLAAGEPQVYLGPPRDEDGHELHLVEII